RGEPARGQAVPGQDAAGRQLLRDRVRRLDRHPDHRPDLHRTQHHRQPGRLVQRPRRADDARGPGQGQAAHEDLRVEGRERSHGRPGSRPAPGPRDLGAVGGPEMYSKDGQNYYILDGHTHFWDGSPANQINRYGEGFIKCFYDYHANLSPEEYKWTLSEFERYPEEKMIHDLFEIGYDDMAI